MTAEFDVVVTGAGPVGTAAALFLRRLGYHVALLERRTLQQAGPSWVNGICPEAFDRVDLPRPTGPELREASFPSVMMSPYSDRRITLTPNPMWNVHMGQLMQRLHHMAQQAGVLVIPRTQAATMLWKADRAHKLLAFDLKKGQRGASRVFVAKLFVDASGMAQTLLGQCPQLHAEPLPPAPKDICLARQEVCAVRDRRLARRYLSELEINPGTMFNLLGVAGGFSTGTVHVAKDMQTVGLLFGTTADQPAGGAQLLSTFKRNNPWIGDFVFGGEGAIPLRRPYDRLVSPGLVVLGNAACSVFPPHGSGVASGFQAALLLATTLEGQQDPGTLDSLWRFNWRYQRQIGSVLAAYDVFRRMSQRIGARGIGQLLSSGLANPSNFAAALHQQWRPPDREELRHGLGSGLRTPLFVASVVKQLAKMPLVHQLYQQFPKRPDGNALKIWSATARALLVD